MKTNSIFLSIRDKFGEETFYDYDNCDYVISRDEATPEFLKFGFNCNCYKDLYENGGKEMLDEIYKENLLPQD